MIVGYKKKVIENSNCLSIIRVNVMNRPQHCQKHHQAKALNKAMSGDRENTNIRRIVQVICFALSFSTVPFPAVGEDFTNAIRAFLQHRGDLEKTEGGIVVGIVDEHGSGIIGYGKLDNGTDQEVSGDTLFGIYSSTCLFTGLLLEDMIGRGEMKLDDPVAKYLPKAVKMPTRSGKEITLRHLLTETSGLPSFADELDPERADNPYADYTVEKMYAFLSDYQLTCDPGAKFEHGGVAMGLLGHVVALKAGTKYESLVVDRICRPLKMDSTRFTLTPELKSRLAAAHPDQFGYAFPSMEMGVLMPLGGLYSTANDLLKFVSANLSLTPSSLPPLMEKCVAHFPVKAKLERERGVVEFGGGNRFIGPYTTFDKTRRRGLVVLSSSGNGLYNARDIGKFLLESEWRSDRRPKATNLSSQVYGLCAGQYQRSPDIALGVFSMRQYFLSAHKAAIFILAGFGLAVFLALLWCAASSRKQWLLLGCVLLTSGVLAVLTPVVWSHKFCARFQPRISIRSEGDRLFAQATGMGLWPIEDWIHAPAEARPIDELLPPLPLELLPRSETRFFERLSGMPVTFSRDHRGKVTCLTVHDQGKAFAYEKISDQPPKLPESPKRPVAIKLDTRLLDACIGHYEQAPCAAYPAGAKVTIWREGDQLMSRASGKNALKGAMEIYPESETNFFNKPGGAVTFVKDDKGEVRSVIWHLVGWPDIVGRKSSTEN
jgi:CubicO group peptidase (beta-lactamase class C family)